MGPLHLTVAPCEQGWELMGQGDRIDEFATRSEARDAALAVAHEVHASGRSVFLRWREPGGASAEAQARSGGRLTRGAGGSAAEASARKASL